jgi:hypothetical protein
MQQAKDVDRRQVALALKGSTKKMIQTSTFVPLPFTLNDLDNWDKLICNPEGVKATMCEYFKRLYDHSWVCKLLKPWVDTPSVARVKRCIEEDRFQWPQETTVRGTPAHLTQTRRSCSLDWTRLDQTYPLVSLATCSAPDHSARACSAHAITIPPPPFSLYIPPHRWTHRPTC